MTRKKSWKDKQHLSKWRIFYIIGNNGEVENSYEVNKHGELVTPIPRQKRRFFTKNENDNITSRICRTTKTKKGRKRFRWDFDTFNADQEKIQNEESLNEDKLNDSPISKDPNIYNDVTQSSENNIFSSPNQRLCFFNIENPAVTQIKSEFSLCNDHSSNKPNFDISMNTELEDYLKEEIDDFLYLFDDLMISSDDSTAGIM
ncbi:hypothetical protein TRFO_16401 [Tritrichomonas foetus]|uniref:Uncharacterized protein n=1 Tax=Tritrichomonas foetus TaxID=1144522 RepID=A0A1J4KV88_9EUKA|nr:hypothetical protein TRFO_16401 [Tritrichomonas foetus]|eukprot:OHT13421.1 hypothetical protein TRFO_16401 [Tritrichomonas foetus]